MQTELYTPSAPATTNAQLLILDCDRVMSTSLSGKANWLIGRSAGSNADIGLHSSIASREHGWLQNLGGIWFYVDNPRNTNGTFLNGVKIPKTGTPQQMRLTSGDLLRIDSSTLGNRDSVVILFTTFPIQGSWTFHSLQHSAITTIGRDPSCSLVEPAPYISARHAQIQNQNGTFILSDCRSKAGTYLNGKRLTAPTALRHKDCISICGRTYFFMGSQLLYPALAPAGGGAAAPAYQAATGNRPVVLQAAIRSKTVKSNTGFGTKELIRDVNLQIREGTLVALLGSAGAGKTTVMNCLNGMELSGVTGSVVYRNVDLTNNFEQMMHLIGSVPQRKTFHPNFSPEREFTIAARKRLPADTTDQEIAQRVDKTLQMLHIDAVRNSLNKKLSGGEQTRVNIGIELVADRDLLCLDEPDQGLSPNYKHELFEILRNLSHTNSKSILAIIHDVSEIDMFDQVIILGKKDGVGRLAFSGTPQEARRYFAVDDFAKIYMLLESQPERYIRG